MAGLMQGLEIGRRALMAQQAWMQTIGHNIANSNTPGYRRQRVDVITSYPEMSTIGPIGSGVTITGVRQARDLFLGVQQRQAMKSLGQWSYKEKTLTQIEATFNEPGESGLSEALDKFWNSWSQLSTDPNSDSNRSVVVQSTNELINRFKHLSQSLEQQRQAVDNDLVNLTEEVNRLTSEIAGLNQQIVTVELGSYQANDLRDARDQLIDQLSNIIDVNVIEKNDGSATVMMGSMALVEKTRSFEIGVDSTRKGASLTHNLVWKGTGVALKNVSGQMAGLMETRDELIPDMQAKLDELAKGVVEQVNTLHTSGYTMLGTTGVAFFDPAFVTAGTMRLSNNIFNDRQLIAASGDPDIDVADGANALAIADLRDTKVLAKDSITINQYYSNLIGELGVQAREAESFTSNYELLEQQISNQKMSVEGVSLDEEMAALVKYQHAYDAAARVIAAMDEALGTLIETMAVVG